MREAATEHRQGDRLVLRDTFRFSEKQREAVWTADKAPPQSEILFDGAIRGGKTQSFCKLLVAWAWKYGGTYVVSRMSYRELEDSTKKVLLRGEGGLPPALPPQLIRATHEGHNKVTLLNGAEILFRSLEPNERGKIRNITLSGWLIDQAEELEDEDILDFYLELKGRLSDGQGPRKVLLIANPGPEEHWLHERFIDPVTKAAKTRRIHCTLHDNRENLPADVYEDLCSTKETKPDFYARMVEGVWGAFGGKRFKCWDARLHVVERVFDIPSGWEIIEGGDYGWAHPFVWEWFAIDFDGRWWGVAEHYAKETRISAHATRIREIRENKDRMLGFEGQLQPSASWFDPSAWSPRGQYSSPADELMEHGMVLAKANNDRLGGWNRIEEFLTDRLPDGYPRLRFFPTCRMAIKELPNLRIKPGTDDVEKVNDDASDACRYPIMSRTPTPLEKKEEDPNTRSAVVKRALARYEQRERASDLIRG